MLCCCEIVSMWFLVVFVICHRALNPFLLYLLDYKKSMECLYS